MKRTYRVKLTLIKCYSTHIFLLNNFRNFIYYINFMLT